jgi:glycyl-tRNA synthetase
MLADIEFNFLWFKELEGIHLRTDFDLKAHEQFGKITVFWCWIEPELCSLCGGNFSRIRPNVLAVFATSLKEETLEDGSTRTVLKLPSVQQKQLFYH